jgi:hypothetical protein
VGRENEEYSKKVLKEKTQKMSKICDKWVKGGKCGRRKRRYVNFPTKWKAPGTDNYHFP